jgi:hypothetical protein
MRIGISDTCYIFEIFRIVLIGTTVSVLLIPGLEFPHEANPQCYLHTLAFSNTLKNVSRTLYDNTTLSLGAGTLSSGGVQLNILAGDCGTGPCS